MNCFELEIFIALRKRALNENVGSDTHMWLDPVLAI